MDSLFFHPKVVHLPIALSVLMPLVTACLVVGWWKGWFSPRTWIVAVVAQSMLFASGLVAESTGESQDHRVEQVVPKRFIEAHHEAAEAFLWSSGAVFAVMLGAAMASRRRSGLPLATAATLGTLVVLALGYRVGQAGGALVYEHGAAEAYQRFGNSTHPRDSGKIDDDD